MRTLLIAAAISVLMPAAPAMAQAAGGGEHAMHAAGADLTKTILDLEAKRIAAMVAKDLAGLDTLLADDLSYTHSAGNTDTKASFITLIKDRGRYLGVDYSNTQVIPWGNDAVLVRGRAEIRLQNTASYPVAFLDVWARRNGRWQMVAWQATRIPQ